MKSISSCGNASILRRSLLVELLLDFFAFLRSLLVTLEVSPPTLSELVSVKVLVLDVREEPRRGLLPLKALPGGSIALA